MKLDLKRICVKKRHQKLETFILISLNWIGDDGMSLCCTPKTLKGPIVVSLLNKFNVAHPTIKEIYCKDLLEVYGTSMKVRQVRHGESP